MQNRFLKDKLQSVPGVSEEATVEGMIKQYQVVLDPNRLCAYDLPLSQVRRRLFRIPTGKIGGSASKMAETERYGAIVRLPLRNKRFAAGAAWDQAPPCPSYSVRWPRCVSSRS